MQRVNKVFNTIDGKFSTGEIADFSETRNFKSLMSQRYISSYTGKIQSCKQCDKKFDNKERLLSHEREFHHEKEE